MRFCFIQWQLSINIETFNKCAIKHSSTSQQLRCLIWIANWFKHKLSSVLLEKIETYRAFSFKLLLHKLFTLIQPINCCQLNVSSAIIFKVCQKRSKWKRILFECQTVWTLLWFDLTRDWIWPPILQMLLDWTIWPLINAFKPYKKYSLWWVPPWNCSSWFWTAVLIEKTFSLWKFSSSIQLDTLINIFNW